MITSRTTDSEQTLPNSRQRISGGDDLPIQPSSLPSPSAAAPNPSSVPIAEPIPAHELPAASPLRDDRREHATRAASRFWWPLALFAVVLTAILVVGALANDRDRGVRGPADQAAPDAPRQEKVPPTAADGVR